MAQINKITYDNKSDPVPITNRQIQATSLDFNEIKEVVNNVTDGVNYIKCDEKTLVSGDNIVIFLAPYALGVPFIIVVSKCVDSNGYLITHTISNKTKDGFTINVSKACTLIYLCAPQR